MMNKCRIGCIVSKKVNFPTSFDNFHLPFLKEISVIVELHLLDIKFNVIFDNKILMMVDFLLMAK